MSDTFHFAAADVSEMYAVTAHNLTIDHISPHIIVLQWYLAANALPWSFSSLLNI